MNSGVGCFGSPMYSGIGRSAGLGLRAFEQRGELLERIALQPVEAGIHEVGLVSARRRAENREIIETFARQRTLRDGGVASSSGSAAIFQPGFACSATTVVKMPPRT